MRIIDHGHFYELAALDGWAYCRLQFVKRIGDNYPGNEGPPSPGTTSQEVLRALIDRANYVNIQIPCAETEAAIRLMEGALLLMEIRAKRVKGKTLDAFRVHDVVDGAVCQKCSHVMCTEDHVK